MSTRDHIPTLRTLRRDPVPAPVGVRLRRAAAQLVEVRTWRHADTALLVAMVVTITAFNLLWVHLDSDRLYWDNARHLGDSLENRDAFTLAHPLRFLAWYPGYPQPPFVYWVTSLFYSVLGTAMWVAVFGNVLFLAILVFATYGIGNRLWSRRVGLLSALFVVASPLFVSQFKWYMLDAPLAAMVALALYLLIRCEGFSRRYSSLALGLVCGLGVLTKWTFALFLLLPAVVVAVEVVMRARRRGGTHELVHFGAASLATIAVAATWYVPNLSTFRGDVSAAAEIPSSVQGTPAPGSLQAALWYFWNLLNNQLYLIPFLFFAVGVVYLFRRNDSAGKNGILALSIVCSYIAFSFIELKTFRYTMPILPAVAVIATHWLEYVRPTTRRWLAGGLAAYCVAAFFVISFGAGFLPKKISLPLPEGKLTSNLFELAPPESVTVKDVVVFAQHGFLVGAPSSEDWHQDDVFREISARGNGPFWYSGPVDEIWFQTWGIRYYAARQHTTWVGTPQLAEFLIVRGSVPPAEVRRGFVAVKEWSLPYSGPLRLYRRA